MLQLHYISEDCVLQQGVASKCDKPKVLQAKQVVSPIPNTCCHHVEPLQQAATLHKNLVFICGHSFCMKSASIASCGKIKLKPTPLPNGWQSCQIPNNHGGWLHKPTWESENSWMPPPLFTEK